LAHRLDRARRERRRDELADAGVLRRLDEEQAPALDVPERLPVRIERLRLELCFGADVPEVPPEPAVAQCGPHVLVPGDEPPVEPFVVDHRRRFAQSREPRVRVGDEREVARVEHSAPRHPRQSANYCLTYGWPSAFGGTERPITPATAISVSTYGSAWKSVAAELEYVGSRNASAVEKPNRSAAPHAPNGRQLPKIIAASAMNPRPSVMFSVKLPVPASIERNAPPSAASIPETSTDA